MKGGANLRGNDDERVGILALATEPVNPELGIEGCLDPVDQLCQS